MSSCSFLRRPTQCVSACCITSPVRLCLTKNVLATSDQKGRGRIGKAHVSRKTACGPEKRDTTAKQPHSPVDYGEPGPGSKITKPALNTEDSSAQRSALLVVCAYSASGVLLM